MRSSRLVGQPVSGTELLVIIVDAAARTMHFDEWCARQSPFPIHQYPHPDHILARLVCCVRWRVQAAMVVIFAAIALPAVAIDTPSENATASATARRPHSLYPIHRKVRRYRPRRLLHRYSLVPPAAWVLRATLGRLRACTAAPLTATPSARARRCCARSLWPHVQNRTFNHTLALPKPL